MEGKALPVSLEFGTGRESEAKQFHRVAPPS